MATLTGELISETYDSLLKVGDNQTITGVKKRITDGFGNTIPLLLSSTDLEIDGNFILSDLENATVDTDKFLVLDTTTVKYRTGSQVLSDIGGQGTITLTTTGTSGASTFISNTLNIPDYGSALTGYLPLAGGTMTGNINWGQTDRGLTWSFNTDGASIKFYNIGDGDTDSRLEFATSDNNNEYFRWGHLPSGGGPFYESMKLLPVSSGNAELIVSGKIIKSGGTSAQFLKADGSVDSTTYGTGTVTSVAAITLGTTGTDLSSTVANGTTTPVITLQVPTASATNRGALSSGDWTTFNGKQAALSGTGIVKSTAGVISYLTDPLPVANGGTGSATQNFVDLTTTQSIGGAKTLTSALAGTSATFANTTALSVAAQTTAGFYNGVAASASGSSFFTKTGSLSSSYSSGFAVDGSYSGGLSAIKLHAIGTQTAGGYASAMYFVLDNDGVERNHAIFSSDGSTTLYGALSGTSASFSSTATATAFIPSGATVPTNGMYLSAANTLNFATNTTNRLSISSTGAATFSGTTTMLDQLFLGTSGANGNLTWDGSYTYLNSGTSKGLSFGTNNTINNRLVITSAGNVEIRSAGQLIAYRSDNTRWGSFYTDGVAVHLTSSTDPIRISSADRTEFYTGGSERMRITSGGNIGMGTASPNGPLDVVGPLYGGLYTLSLIDSAAVAADIGGGIYFGGNYTGTTKTGWAGILGRKDNATDGQYGGYMAFLTRTNGSAPAERMRITSGGDVGIGTSTITYATANRKVLILNGSNNGALLGLNVNDVSDAYFYSDGASTYLSRIPSSGNLNVVVGTAGGGVYLGQSATSWASLSDERLKNINSNIDNALSKLMTLRTVNFTWKSDKKNKENLGLIAQDVEKVFPQVIDRNKLNKGLEKQEDETEYLGVKYQELIPVLVKAIQELKAEIDLLKGIAPIEPEPIEEVEPIVEPIEPEVEIQPNN